MSPLALATLLSVASFSGAAMPDRKRLPFRRASETLALVHTLPDGNTQDLLITYSRFEDGSIGEVFINYPPNLAKHSTALLGNDVATLISIALQYGAPLSVLRDAMGRSDVNRMGTVADLPHTVIGTVLDALTRETTP